MFVSILLLLFLATIVFIICTQSFTKWSFTTRSPTLKSRLHSNATKEKYVAILIDPINRQCVESHPCKDGRTLSLVSTIENSLFLMEVSGTYKATLRPIFSQISSNLYFSSTPGSECPTTSPSLSGVQTQWLLMDPRDPISPKPRTLWKSSNEGTIIETKLMTTEKDFVVMENHSLNLSKKLDEASTINILLPNKNMLESSFPFMGLIRFQNLYLNHTSTVPLFSSTPTSPIFLFHFTNNLHENGFNESEFTIQSHPLSNTSFFPSWYVNWDLKSGCVMQSSNPMSWTFEISSQNTQPYGMEFLGYLKHQGYYLTIANPSTNATTSTLMKPSSPISIILFNKYFL